MVGSEHLVREGRHRPARRPDGGARRGREGGPRLQHRRAGAEQACGGLAGDQPDAGLSQAPLRLLPALLLRLHRHRARPRRAVRARAPCCSSPRSPCWPRRTKLVPAYLAARPLGSREASIVGVGMIPRGEVGIVVASIGAAEGVVDAELFGVVVGMSIPDHAGGPFALRRLTTTRDQMPRRARQRRRGCRRA